MLGFVRPSHLDGLAGFGIGGGIVPGHHLVYSLSMSFNMFIYQARGVWPGPSRFSDSPVSAENVIYEAFVLMGKLRWTFSPLVILLAF